MQVFQQDRIEASHSVKPAVVWCGAGQVTCKFMQQQPCLVQPRRPAGTGQRDKAMRLAAQGGLVDGRGQCGVDPLPKRVKIAAQPVAQIVRAIGAHQFHQAAQGAGSWARASGRTIRSGGALPAADVLRAGVAERAATAPSTAVPSATGRRRAQQHAVGTLSTQPGGLPRRGIAGQHQNWHMAMWRWQFAQPDDQRRASGKICICQHQVDPACGAQGLCLVRIGKCGDLATQHRQQGRDRLALAGAGDQDQQPQSGQIRQGLIHRDHGQRPLRHRQQRFGSAPAALTSVSRAPIRRARSRVMNTVNASPGVAGALVAGATSVSG